MPTRRAQRTFAILVIVGGAALAWQVVQRAGPSKSSEEDAPTDVVSLAVSGQIEHDVQPTEETVEEVAFQVADAAMDSIASLPVERRPPPRLRSGLRSLIKTQIGLALLPDYHRWLAHVRRFGGEPQFGGVQEARRESESEENRRQRWERSAACLRLAPLSVSAVIARARWVRGKAFEPRSRPRAVLYPFFRGSYSERVSYAEEEAGVAPAYPFVYEILVPVRYQQGDPTDSLLNDINAVAGFFFAWDESDKRWRPYDLRIYDSAIESAKSIGPVF